MTPCAGGWLRRAPSASYRWIIGSLRSIAFRPRLTTPQVDDARDTADWVFRHAADLGAEPSHIAIGGDSAGGYLSLATALAQPGRFAALLLIYPLLHLEDDVWSEKVLKDARFVGRLAVSYIRAQLKAAASGVPSLLGTARADLPPTLIVTGGALDPVRPDALRYAAELRDAGARCDCVEHARQPHGFFNLTHLSQPARDAAADAGRRLGAILTVP
jgi:acetyl esterase